MTVIALTNVVECGIAIYHQFDFNSVASPGRDGGRPPQVTLSRGVTP